MPACKKSSCANITPANQSYCDPCIDGEARRIKKVAKDAIARIRKWRKDYNDGGYNCGDNWRQGINYQCVGGTNNAIKGHKAAIAKLVKEKYLDGSDSGQFKHRYVVEKPNKNILVHVDSTDTL